MGGQSAALAESLVTSTCVRKSSFSAEHLHTGQVGDAWSQVSMHEVQKRLGHARQDLGSLTSCMQMGQLKIIRMSSIEVEMWRKSF